MLPLHQFGAGVWIAQLCLFDKTIIFFFRYFCADFSTKNYALCDNQLVNLLELCRGMQL